VRRLTRFWAFLEILDPTGMYVTGIGVAAGRRTGSDLVVNMALAHLPIGMQLREAKSLVGSWGAGTMETIAKNISYHFSEHGAQVGAKDIFQYMRKATAFKQNLKGATRATVEHGNTRFTKTAATLFCIRIRRLFLWTGETVTALSDSNTMELACKLQGLFSDLPHPFPHSDCQKLFSVVGERVRHLAPDLDLYSSWIAGYCSRGPRLTRLTVQQICDARKVSAKPFFEQHSEYLPIRPLITEEGFPELATRLSRIEEMRLLLLNVLDRIESQVVQ